MTAFESYLISTLILFMGLWGYALNELRKKSNKIGKLQQELNHANERISILEKTK